MGWICEHRYGYGYVGMEMDMQAWIWICRHGYGYVGMDMDTWVWIWMRRCEGVWV